MGKQNLSTREHGLAECCACEEKMKSRTTDPGLLQENQIQENQIILGYDLGRAALSRLVVFFVLALVLALAASLFLLILLTGLALLALTGLAALLAVLTGLATLLSRLTTLLSVLLCIVCHEIVLR
jgi:hypothetical protein